MLEAKIKELEDELLAREKEYQLAGKEQKKVCHENKRVYLGFLHLDVCESLV